MVLNGFNQSSLLLHDGDSHGTNYLTFLLISTLQESLLFLWTNPPLPTRVICVYGFYAVACILK